MRPNRIAKRSRYTRTGGRNILTNSPDGWMSNPAIPQPLQGFDNPGVHWVGTDTWGLVNGGSSNLAAANRALELIAGSIAGLPWRVRRNETELISPTPVWIDDPQMARWDGRIQSGFSGWDNRLSPVAFREQIVCSLVLRGNAYVFVPLRDSKGSPVAPLFVLHPDDVDIKDGGYWVGNERLPSGSVIHVSGRGPYDEQGRGKGVLDSYADSLGLLAMAQERATSALNSAVPVGVIEVNSGYSIDQEEATQLRSDWEQMHSGRHGVAVLNSTLSFKPLSWSPESLQLIQMAEFGLRNVAYAFGLSPSWFGIEDNSLQYSTVVMRASELRTFTLLPWVRRIEAQFDSELPRGQELAIVLDGLERGTTMERYQAYAVAIQAGFMSVERARFLEGWPSEQAELQITEDVNDDLAD